MLPRDICQGNWDLSDKSGKPKKIYTKITSEIELEVIRIKKETGWGAQKIESFVELGHTTINKISRDYKLSCGLYERKLIIGNILSFCALIIRIH